MKTLFAALAVLMALTAPLSAGTLVFEAEEEEEIIIVEEEPMGSSGAWIIPLLAIGMIALAMSQEEQRAR